MRTLGVATGRYREEDLHAAGADHVVADLSDAVGVAALLLA